MKLNRRLFISASASITATMAAPTVFGATRPKVVVIGGGAGGATAARYIAKDSKGAIDVTLVEPTRSYYTCFFSNLYIGGFRDFDSIGHTYGKLANDYGINVVHDWAVDVDSNGKTVTLAGGGSLNYDKLILSPGIDFVDGSVPGWDLSSQNKMPHSYKAGSQTQLLSAQIDNMKSGGTYCMVAPPNPFRCPPGPYERVSMVAHKLKKSNPNAKILILDPKPKFSKQGLFEEGWNKHYSGMIERIGPDMGGNSVEVRPDSMEVVIDGSSEKVDVCNVIPAMKAGKIAEIAGVTDGNWAPVIPHTMQSRKNDHIHVLGDASSQGDMPKSGFSANSQAKVCAMAVRAALTDSKLFPAKFSNTCWSLVDTNDGIKVGASYEATDEKIAKVSGFVSKTGEDAALRKATYEESLGWYSGITSDMFG
ncbi:MAG: NAD(P)/FAD-dependent oxidoreductase [Pseudomonadota bacterium]|nr:NAD(P)/FAD-dependent oxidoreductase [Pseudomonadota bacterium]